MSGVLSLVIHSNTNSDIHMRVRGGACLITIRSMHTATAGAEDHMLHPLHRFALRDKSPLMEEQTSYKAFHPLDLNNTYFYGLTKILTHLNLSLLNPKAASVTVIVRDIQQDP